MPCQRLRGYARLAAVESSDYVQLGLIQEVRRVARASLRRMAGVKLRDVPAGHVEQEEVVCVLRSVVATEDKHILAIVRNGDVLCARAKLVAGELERFPRARSKIQQVSVTKIPRLPREATNHEHSLARHHGRGVAHARGHRGTRRSQLRPPRCCWVEHPHVVELVVVVLSAEDNHLRAPRNSGVAVPLAGRVPLKLDL